MDTSPMDMKRIFIKELKKKYKKLCHAVQPVPFIRDKVYSVNRVFVEGGLEFFVSSWVMLDSYHQVFREPMVRSGRRIVLGDPGYGKSILALQFAYDWCEEVQESYLKGVEILILLRLRQLGNVRCVYKAIKRYILSHECELTESHIKSVLEGASSVVVILDGFDEYPLALSASCNETDVMKIITERMFEDFEVILTSRYLPEQYTRETKRLRLTGLDDRAREEYIKKAVTNGNENAAKELKLRLEENPVLGDLCQITLLFVLFAHMSHDKSEEFHSFTTVTRFFQHIIKCFHQHWENKMEEENVQRYHTFDHNHDDLNEVAFQGLQRKRQHIVWTQGKLCDLLGEDFFRQYVRVGILVTDEGNEGVNEAGCTPRNLIEVRFYHKLFCEWYAAHFLAKCAKGMNVQELKDLLVNMDPNDLHHCFRFACGLDPDVVGKVIEVLKAKEDGKKYIALCVFESGGRIDDILDTVTEMCSGTINLSSTDSNLYQRSVVQLLQTSVHHQIPISEVYLYNCFKEVDLSDGNYLQLKSDVYFPVLNTLKKLWIREEGKELTSQQFDLVLHYASKYPSLEKLWLGMCLLPRNVGNKSVLGERRFKVLWKPSVQLRPYVLCFDTGTWKSGDNTITDEDYLDAVAEVRNRHLFQVSVIPEQVM